MGSSRVVLLVLLCTTWGRLRALQFNYEVEKRVVDRITNFLADPSQTNQFLATYRENGAFRHGLTAPDRDDFIKLAYSVALPLVYCGLEDGSHMG